MERWQKKLDEEWNDEELVEKIFVDNPPYDIEELTKEEILKLNLLNKEYKKLM